MIRSSSHFVFVPALAAAVFVAAMASAVPEVQAGPKFRRVAPVIGAGVLILGAAAAMKAEERRKRELERRRYRARKRAYQRTVKRSPTVKRSYQAQFSRDQIATAQTALAKMGLYSSSIDGLNGPGTRRAVAAFQGQSGYKVTGYLTQDQYVALTNPPRTPAVAAGTPPAQSGDHRQSVQDYGARGSAPVAPGAGTPSADGTVPGQGAEAPRDPGSAASSPSPVSSVLQTQQ